MEYLLVVSPDLDLSAEEVAAAWNADASTRALASLRLSPSSAQQFDQTLVDIVVTLASTVSIGLFTNALYDVLKTVLKKKGEDKPRRHMKLTQLDQPDGTHLLIVESEEQ